MARHRFVPFLALYLVAYAAPLARAADWATGVVSYSAGFTYPSPDPNNFSFVPPAGGVDQAYTFPTLAQLNGISVDTGEGTSFHSILTPFNAAYQPIHYVGVGQGGSITLQFPTPVRTNGVTLGIHTASGLVDFDYPNGGAGTTATAYTTPRRAMIEVSANGTNWFNAGTLDLNNPSNYYATGVDTPGFQASDAAGTLADVSKPFIGTLASFNGESWPQMLTTLNGSAGGNWIDLSSSGLSSVSFVRLSVPTGSILYLDGVVGLPTPEPASLSCLALGLLALAARRRRRV